MSNKLIWTGCIKGQPITKKNSQRLVVNPKTRKTIIMPSKAYKDYEKNAAHQLQKPPEPISVPVNVLCIYYMETRRACDLTNLMEATHDILVKHGILSDDNSKIIVGVDGSRVSYDKENPRVEIEITESKE